MTQVEIIAQRGASVLIRVGHDCGRIFDRRHGRLFAPQSIDSALARGYWGPFKGDRQAVVDELSRAQEVVGDDTSASANLFRAIA